MDDARYAALEDIRERKRTASGARHKINGSKSRKVTFPHEYLSRKELKAMSGEVKIWIMKKFYTYDEFKQMPADLQVEYLNGMMDDYDVGLETIAREVLGTSGNSVKRVMLKNETYNKLKLKTGRSRSGIKNLIRDVQKARNNSSENVSEDIESPNMVIPEPKNEKNLSSEELYDLYRKAKHKEMLDKQYRDSYNQSIEAGRTIKAFMDGLVDSGFTEDQAFQMCLTAMKIGMGGR